jgi:hypothetical protein
MSGTIFRHHLPAPSSGTIFRHHLPGTIFPAPSSLDDLPAKASTISHPIEIRVTPQRAALGPLANLEAR